MSYQFQFSTYHYRFKCPLQTHHGRWEVRTGVILKLIATDGQVGWGEIAPIPWFGSETLEQAIEFCQTLPQLVTDDLVFSIPDRWPACQFGFEMALQGLSATSYPEQALRYSRLLPAGEAALYAWQPLWDQGYRTFKWKIGVYGIVEELVVFEQLIQALPASTTLRLDANGGLSLEEANRWLQRCDRVNLDRDIPIKIEYLEQPLPPTHLPELLELSHRYSTPIALDESVATLQQLRTCYEQGWQGIFVIKPAIAGSPARLRQFCQTHAIDAVFSTAFETAIGRKAGLQLAAELGNPDRAVGYEGTAHDFDYFEPSIAALDCLS